MHHFTERNYFPALLPLAPCLYKRHSNQRPRHAADELRARKGGAAGDKWWGLEAGWGGETEFASTDGGMKQAKEGVAGLTILKPDLAFLKAGVRHQLPSFPSFQRHKQSCFLPERWPAHQKEKRKKKKNKEKEGKEGKCVRENTPASEAGEEKCGEAHKISFYLPPRFPFWSNRHRFQWWCCLLTSVAVNDTEPGSYGSDGRSEKRRRKTRGEEKGKEEGRTQQSMCHWGKRRRGDTKVKPLRWQQREKLTGNQKPSPERNEERTKKKRRRRERYERHREPLL